MFETPEKNLQNFFLPRANQGEKVKYWGTKRLIMLLIYNCFKGKLREFCFTKGSQDQFCLENIQSAARHVVQTNLVEVK